ncbi:MAG: VCBS repeat-containing protein [Pirellulaceae bacterium]
MMGLPDSRRDMKLEHLYRLGKRRLWLGDTREAIEHFHNAYELVKHDGDKKKGSQWELVVFQLGLAYLRLGENENCVKCNNGESCLIPIQNAGVHKNQEGSRRAIEYFRLLLTHDPLHSEARWLINVAYMTIGEYPHSVANEYQIDPRRFESDIDFKRFNNIAGQMGLDTVNLSGGCVVDDLDGDGDLDIMTSSWGCADPLHYFRNESGIFKEVTQDAGLAGLFGGLNLIQADYDNDGDIDILVLRGAWMREAGHIPNSLLQNDGVGNFRDVTFESGLGESHHPTQTAAWLDYDNDGDLDLYVGNEHAPCQLFQNDGDGRFVDVASKAGVNQNAFAKSVACGDFNGDRFMDIYVSNQGQDNRLYRNNRDGTFSNVADELRLNGPRASFASWFWDFNQDGRLDLFVASYSYGLNYIDQKYFGDPPVAEFDALYMGNQDGHLCECGVGNESARANPTHGRELWRLE